MGAATWKVFIEYKDGSTTAFSTQHPRDCHCCASLSCSVLDHVDPEDIVEVCVKRVGSD